MHKIIKFISIIGILFLSTVSYGQNKKPGYEFEIIRTKIIYEHNADSTLVKLYNENKELLRGKYKIIHEDSTETYVGFKEGLWDGLYQTYYKTGELQFSLSCENGIKMGTGKWFYKNGNVKSEIPYLNRQQHGICKWYYENGTLLKECEYVFDKENGVCKWFYENGKIQMIVTYKNGIKNGIAERYKPNGDLEHKIFYLNNERVTEKQFKLKQKN